MAKKTTRSELNETFYSRLNDEIQEIKKTSETNINKLTNFKKRLSLINDEYFSQIIAEIDQTIGVQSLYLDDTLTDEEKFFTIKKALKEYLDEISAIVDQKIELVNNFEVVFELKDNEIASSVNDKLTELLEEMTKLPSIKNKNEQILTEFEKFYPNMQKNLLIIDSKFEKEKDGGMPYKERLQKIKVNNKNLITKIKRNLNQYRLKWLWYLITVGFLIIGIILCILIPIFI